MSRLDRSGSLTQPVSDSKSLTSMVMLFEEAEGLDRSKLGGKGYGLVEMVTIGLPVPPGIIVTTEACKYYYAHNRVPPSGLFDEIGAKLGELEKKTSKRLGDPERPLLLSVRSGAPFSMPGMMDTILNLGLNDEVTETLAKTVGRERFALDSYRRFIQMFGKVALGIKAQDFEDILETCKSRQGVRQDVDLSPDSLRGIIREFKKLVKTRTGHEMDQDPLVHLEKAVLAVFESWNNDRAREYRKFYKISDDLGTAVTLQSMVFGNMGENSGSGVGFTRNPSTGEEKLYGEYLQNSQGEDVVSGTRTPESLERLPANLANELVDLSNKLERHFREMQDFEFTVENGKLYVLQTRNGKRTAQAAVKIAVDMAIEGLISKEEALARVDPKEAEHLLHRALDPNVKVHPIAKGLNASPGAASGKVVFDTEEAASRGVKGERLILVRPETTPEDIRGLIASQGVLTIRGGMTSHAAVVARGMGKPAVVGCSSIKIDHENKRFTTVDGIVVKKDDLVTLDGSSGQVILGEVPTVEPELGREFATLLAWADEKRRLGVWANADTGEMAQKAKDFGADGIGLCRTERMFNAPDRLPIVREMIMSDDELGRRDALRRLVPFQLADFKEIFRIMAGKPVTIRLLDLPLHEFLPSAEEIIEEMESMRRRKVPTGLLEEKARLLAKVHQLSEHNPMLGHRGCRLAVTHPEIYEMQTEAVIRAAIEVRRQKGETIRVLIMLPLVSTVNEMALLRKVVEASAQKVFRELGESIEFKVGTMIETPRAALTAAELAEHADFFSFGTNDLTQNTFAFSRDDAEAKFMTKYLEGKLLEESPFEVLDVRGVGRLIQMATSEGRKANPKLEVGVCGEQGGEPASVAFFNEAGLDYVSCSAYRIPIARLAAARATIVTSTKHSTTV